MCTEAKSTKIVYVQIPKNLTVYYCYISHKHTNGIKSKTENLNDFKLILLFTVSASLELEQTNLSVRKNKQEATHYQQELTLISCSGAPHFVQCPSRLSL